jgi:hypothetical protein
MPQQFRHVSRPNDTVERVGIRREIAPEPVQSGGQGVHGFPQFPILGFDYA